MVLQTPIKGLLSQVNARRADLNMLKGDIEVWVGIYLIVGWFFSMTELL